MEAAMNGKLFVGQDTSRVFYSEKAFPPASPGETMQALVEVVQHNCDIVDARHGSDYGICTYLLKMRELYRWQRGLALGARLGKEEVGDWLTRREDELEALEQEEFRALPLDGQLVDPFDAERVNAVIGRAGLVYSAGLAQGARPNFFIAELEREQRADGGFLLRVSGRELARCLNSPPAMTRGSSIFLRRESLRRQLWERYESWLWSRPQNAMARAVACYPFDTALEHSLDAMTAAEMTVIEAHERGEHQAGLDLGEGWEDMLLDLSLTPAELMARAVRDHLADCTHTLPILMQAGREASLHLFIGGLSAMRRQLFPSLRLAYDEWVKGESKAVFSDPIERGERHWRKLAQRMLVLHGRGGDQIARRIAAEVEAAFL
jgi:hypothetical protein